MDVFELSNKFEVLQVLRSELRFCLHSRKNVYNLLVSLLTFYVTLNIFVNNGLKNFVLMSLNAEFGYFPCILFLLYMLFKIDGTPIIAIFF